MKEAEAIDRLRQVLRRQHKALATEDAYVHWLRRYIKALPHMPSGLPSEKKLEKFLTDLALKHDVSASTQNQAFNAILFFYQAVLEQPLGNVRALRASRPVHERYSPNVSETQALLQTVPNQGGYPTHLVARMLYGCGLRVSEPLNLHAEAPERLQPVGHLAPHSASARQPARCFSWLPIEPRSSPCPGRNPLRPFISPSQILWRDQTLPQSAKKHETVWLAQQRLPLLAFACVPSAAFALSAFFFTTTFHAKK
jgi:hypothetical protein